MTDGVRSASDVCIDRHAFIGAARPMLALSLIRERDVKSPGGTNWF